MMKKILAILLVFTLAVGLLPITAFAEPVNDLSMCNLRFGGSDGQYDVVVESKDEAVHLDEIPVEVIDRNGNEVDPKKYDLTVSVYKGWDEENQSPDILWLTDTFRLTDYDVYAEQGYGWFGVSATAKDGSGLTGSTRPQNINVRHLYSFNGYCVTVKFDDSYKVDNNPWADQNYYVIPSNRIFDPEVWNRADEFVDPKYYTVTYYRRNMDDLDYDDYRDPEYLAQRYPEVNPLDGIPSEPGCYFAVTEAKAPYYGKNYVDIDIIEPESENNLGKDFELLIDGEGWKVFPVESLNDLLSIDDLNITVVDKNGNILPEDAYLLNIGMQVGWDDEENMPIISEVPAPYGVDFDPNDEDRSSGFTSYRVNAVAKNDSGYTGSTDSRDFMIWHKYSFNYFGANADFGEEYKRQSTWSWHDFFEIPANEIEEPVIHGVAYEDVDPQYYDITYFERVTGIPVDQGADYQGKVYSETDPLPGLPHEPGHYFARIDGKAPYYGTSYVDFDVTEAVLKNDFSKDVELRFRGEKEWAQDYYLDGKNDTLTLEELDITVVTSDGEVVPADQYELHIGIQTGYDDEKQEPIIEPVEEPFGLTSDEAQLFGWQMHCVTATAKEGGNYVGETRVYEFMLREMHSLERDSAFIDFGERYMKEAFRSWHYYYEIPEGEIKEPDVYNCLHEKLDKSQYMLTYFERYDEFDSPEQRYAETTPLNGMPTTPGHYFVRLDGKAPYYGKSYVDFDIVEVPVSYTLVYGSDARYFDGETIYMEPDSEMLVRFDLTGGPEDQLAGWISDQLRNAGFGIEEPVDLNDGYAYCQISSACLAPGTAATLDYSWYHFFDVFHNGSFHWDGAVPFMNASVNIEVVAQGGTYLLGDADNDGSISIVDATIIQRYLAQMDIGVYEETVMQGDVDQNGVLDITDATFLSRWLSSMSVPCEIEKIMKVG